MRYVSHVHHLAGLTAGSQLMPQKTAGVCAGPESQAHKSSPFYTVAVMGEPTVDIRDITSLNNTVPTPGFLDFCDWQRAYGQN